MHVRQQALITRGAVVSTSSCQWEITEDKALPLFDTCEDSVINDGANTDHVRIIPLPLSIVTLSSASILLHSYQALGTTYAIIVIVEVRGIARKEYSSGYPVVAGKCRLSCTEHRDR